MDSIITEYFQDYIREHNKLPFMESYINKARSFICGEVQIFVALLVQELETSVFFLAEASKSKDFSCYNISAFFFFSTNDQQKNIFIQYLYDHKAHSGITNHRSHSTFFFHIHSHNFPKDFQPIELPTSDIYIATMT